MDMYDFLHVKQPLTGTSMHSGRSTKRSINAKQSLLRSSSKANSLELKAERKLSFNSSVSNSNDDSVDAKSFTTTTLSSPYAASSASKSSNPTSKIVVKKKKIPQKHSPKWSSSKPSSDTDDHSQHSYSLSANIPRDTRRQSVALIHICHGICLGMNYLHESGILHRDLKSRNVMLTAYLTAKVSDFGLSGLKLRSRHLVAQRSGLHRRQSQKKQQTVKTRGLETKDTLRRRRDSELHDLNKFVGTPLWCAPEVLAGESCTEASDVYSMGIILSEIITGRTPFDDLAQVTVPYRVVMEGLRPSLEIPEEWVECIEDMKVLCNIAQMCWQSDPEERPSFKQLAEQLESVVDGHENGGATRIRMEKLGNKLHKISGMDETSRKNEKTVSMASKSFYESGKAHGLTKKGSSGRSFKRHRSGSRALKGHKMMNELKVIIRRNIQLALSHENEAGEHGLEVATGDGIDDPSEVNITMPSCVIQRLRPALYLKDRRQDIFSATFLNEEFRFEDNKSVLKSSVTEEFQRRRGLERIQVFDITDNPRTVKAIVADLSKIRKLHHPNIAAYYGSSCIEIDGYNLFCARFETSAFTLYDAINIDGLLSQPQTPLILSSVVDIPPHRIATMKERRPQVSARTFNLETILSIMCNIVGALMHLESLGIQHRRLDWNAIYLFAPTNVAMESEMTFPKCDIPLIAKIYDYAFNQLYKLSSSSLQVHNVIEVSVEGTFNEKYSIDKVWCAPEILLQEYYNEKASVYTCGLVLFAMLALREPFGFVSLDRIQICRQIVNDKLRPRFEDISKRASEWDNASMLSRLKDIMMRAWNPDIEQRWTLEELHSELLSLRSI